MTKNKNKDVNKEKVWENVKDALTIILSIISIGMSVVQISNHIDRIKSIQNK